MGDGVAHLGQGSGSSPALFPQQFILLRPQKLIDATQARLWTPE